MTGRLPAALRGAPVLLAVVSLALAGGSVAPAAAATPAPGWRVEAVANPTAFSSQDASVGECAPCDQYEVLVTNVGGSHSNEEAVTVTDTLPPGVTTSSRRSGDAAEFWSCGPAEAGLQVLTCTISGELLRLLRPGPLGALAQLPALPIYVQVEPGVPPDTVRANALKVEGGGAPAAATSTPTLLNPSASLPFGLAQFGSFLADVAGNQDTQAAGHPNSLTTSFDVNSAVNQANGNLREPTRSVQDVKDLVVDLPPGLVGNPQATPRCPLHELVTNSNSSGCPATSVVGRLSFDASGTYQDEYYRAGRQNIPVYNMVPEQGHPAEFGFDFAEKPLVMYASVLGSGAGTHVRVTLPGVPASQLLSLQGAEVTFFGDPTRQDSSPTEPVPFFTNPSDCSGEPLVTTIHLDSWQAPGARNGDGTPDFSDPAWRAGTASAPTMQGCAALHFNPTLSLLPDTPEAGAPTGLSVHLAVPQSGDPSIPATPDVRKVTVTLPAGMVISPSAANGLGACSPQQIGLQNNDTPACPDSSKIGTVKVRTPLLEQPLEGAVYLAQQGNAGPAQGANPFGSLLAIYLVAEGSGVVVKLPGKVEADERTGQLTTTFDEDPQLPFSDLTLHFKAGAGAPVSNPPACGAYDSNAQLSSWSGQNVQLDESFPINEGENGAPCPAGSFAPSFTAGTSNNQAAASSTFSVTLARSDQDQTLGAVTVHMPPGLLGKIAGIEQCPAPQAAAGTCGPQSLIGHTTVAAGPGPSPFYVGGSVFLTGPYRGAPFGLSIVVPVVAGPFNLGTEVVRAAIAVDPRTAQITVSSDPLPTIKQGIPFQTRTVNVTIDRPGFIVNPSSCERFGVNATITSTQATSVGASSPFQAASCAALPFRPAFSPSTQAGGNFHGASLEVKISQLAGEAAIRKVDTQLPLALPSRLVTLQKACPEAQFAANPAGCPPGSDVGIAKASTPLLNVPLSGPAYLVSHGGAAFPDLDIILQGEGVTIDLVGNTDIKKGITFSRFETVPDAPISSFDLTLPGGPGAVLAAIKNLCAPTRTVTVSRRLTRRVHGHPRRVTVKVNRSVPESLLMPTTITGQNGAVVQENARIAVHGCAARPTLRLTKLKLAGNAVLLTVTSSRPGTATISGRALKTLERTLRAGTQQLRVPLSRAGARARARRHAKTTVQIKLQVDSGAVTTTATLIL